MPVEVIKEVQIIKEVEVIKEVPVTLTNSIEKIKSVEMFTEKAVVMKSAKTNGMGYSSDYLQIVEGIGPKIEQLLKDGGIHNWSDLSNAPIERLHEILKEAGPRFKMHDPTTWPKQAKLAKDGKWEELKDYQDSLDGGKIK